jgi:hypothetical protein
MVMVVLAALLALTAAPGVVAQEQQPAGKLTFTVGIINDIDSLNPFIGILAPRDHHPHRRAARPDPGPGRLPLPPPLPGPGLGRGRPGGRGRPLPQPARAHPARPGRASCRLLPD